MALAGVNTDLLKVYGKQFTLLHVQWTVGATGAVASVKGHGFDSSAATPHKGSVVRTDTGDYTITLPGDGGSMRLMSVLQFEHVINGSGLTRTYALDLTDGTVDVTFDASSTPTDPDSGDEVHMTFLVSNWPHFQDAT